MNHRNKCLQWQCSPYWKFSSMYKIVQLYTDIRFTCYRNVCAQTNSQCPTDPVTPIIIQYNIPTLTWSLPTDGQSDSYIPHLKCHLLGIKISFALIIRTYYCMMEVYLVYSNHHEDLHIFPGQLCPRHWSRSRLGLCGISRDAPLHQGWLNKMNINQLVKHFMYIVTYL